jgi:DNA polymerase-3 subunit beta
MIVQQFNLNRAVAWCARFANRKSTIPMLKGVRLTGGLAPGTGGLRSELAIEATDLELAGGLTCPGKGGKSFDIVVDAALLVKTVKNLDPGDVEIEGSDGGLTIKQGADVFSVPLLADVSSWPEIPRGGEIETSLDGGELRGQINGVKSAICTEVSRFTLSGALLELCAAGAGLKFRLIATDGHRMAWYGDTEKWDGVRLALLPARLLEELARDKSATVWLSFSGAESTATYVTPGFIHARLADGWITSRLLTGSFPDWRRVAGLEGTSVDRWRVPVKEFSRALAKVIPFADERSHAVILDVSDGKLTLKVEVEGKGAAQSAIGGELVSGNGVSLPQGFDTAYLVDYLKSINGAEEVEFDAAMVEKMPCGIVFHGPGGQHYRIMPQRI